MKYSRKFLVAALSVMMASSLTAGVALAASADEATKDHVFDSRNDVVFEDFDRADISDTVTADADGVDIGEKPYLSVTYDAITADTAVADKVSQIFKQGSGSLATVASGGGTITLRMRAPEGDVSLSELNFGVRSPSADSDSAVYARGFDELFDADGESLPELTTEWQDYVISFSTSYESDEVYPGTDFAVTAVDLAAIHIFADEGETGTIDIASVMYNTSYLNNFTGGDTVDATGRVADAGFYWAGSTYGTVVKRTVTTTGGEFSVVKDTAVGDYKYAVIEVDGDATGLTVSTTTDGTTWSTPAAYDGYSVTLTGEEKGFKFGYTGETSATVKRIYLTNLEVIVPDTYIPVLDATSADLLDDFSVSQSGFTGVWEDMSTRPELEPAGMEYRLSYNNGDKVEIKDGALVFDGTNLAADGYINFKFKSLGSVQGDYVVLKVKGEEGADLSGFRFALGDPDDAYGDIIWTRDMNAGVQLPIAALDSSNPYVTDDGWYYVVIDIEESGFAVSETGYSGLDIYWGGTGKLSIDSIFFANAKEVPNIEADNAYADAVLDLDATTDYAYAYMYADNSDGYGTTLSFDITPDAADFDISKLRLEFQGVGTFWASTNDQGTLKTTEGKTLDQLTYTAGQPTHVEIDLAASGIEGAFEHIHVHRESIGGFVLDNLSLHTSTPVDEAIALDTENAVTVDKTVNFVPTTDGYVYVDGIDVAANKYGQLSFTLTPGEGFTATDLRFEFAGAGTYWAFENEQGTLITSSGVSLGEFLTSEGIVAGTPVEVTIDLVASGVSSSFSAMHIHSSGTLTGPFTMEEITYTPFVDYLAPYYEEQMGLFDNYLDNTDPTVSISTATTATAGDTVNVTYTASDNITATADLDVTISVTKDGSAVTLTNGSFTAEEGVYTVTVTVRDAAGNEASDTIQITVSAGTTDPGTDPEPAPEPEGLGGGAIAGIVIGAVVVVAAVVVAVVLVKRKNSKGE